MKTKLMILLLVVALLLGGCITPPDDAAIRQEAQAVLDGLADGDYNAVRADLSRQISDATLRGAFDDMSEAVRSLGEYEMEVNQWNYHTKDGVTTTSIRYLLTAGEERLYLDVTKIDGEDGLYGFFLRSVEEGEAQRAERSSGIAGWVVTGFGVAAIAFMIWMVVDCVRRKLKYKWLYVLLIVLVSMVLNVSYNDGGMKMQTLFGLHLGLSGLTSYASGGFALELYFPLGAVVYCFLRKKLTVPDPEPAESANNCAEISDEALLIEESSEQS
jgi:hypothetical protein